MSAQSRFGDAATGSHVLCAQRRTHMYGPAILLLRGVARPRAYSLAPLNHLLTEVSNQLLSCLAIYCRKSHIVDANGL